MKLNPSSRPDQPVNTYALFAVSPQIGDNHTLTLIPYCQSGGAAELLPDQSTLRLPAGFTYQISYSACADHPLGLEPTINGLPRHSLLARPDPAARADCPPCVAGSFLLPVEADIALRFILRPDEIPTAGTVSILRTPL